MMDWVERLAGRVLNRVRVNDVYPGIHNGGAWFIKRRRTGAGIVIWFANRFLALAHSSTRMFAGVAEWTDWERHCFRLLYPDLPDVIVIPDRTVMLPKVGGTSLRALLQRGDPAVRRAFVLAARELRRAHQVRCSRYSGPWSHGDLHLDNVLCDVTAERAVLIDFDIRHDFESRTTWRHADDVKLVLLELLGSPDEKWFQLATTFLDEYGDRAVLAELNQQLVVPRGFARLLWYTRTNGAPMHQVASRLQTLREWGISTETS